MRIEWLQKNASEEVLKELLDFANTWSFEDLVETWAEGCKSQDELFQLLKQLTTLQALLFKQLLEHWDTA